MNAEAAYFAASKAYQKGQYVPALEHLSRLLDVSGDAKTFVLLAKTLIKLNMPAEAAASYQKAAEAGGRRADEYLLRAMELHVEAGDDDSALLAAKGIAHKAHEDPEIAFILASIFRRRGDVDVLEGLRKPLIDSKDPRHLALAVQLAGTDPDSDDDRRTYANAIKKMPARHELRFYYQYLLRQICDFDQIRAYSAPINAKLKAGDPAIFSFERPWTSVIWCGDERLNALSRKGVASPSASVSARRRAMKRGWSDRKIRIGYLSSDFWSKHATMKLLADVLKRHDRDRFDVFLFCYTPDNLLEMNRTDRSQWGTVVPVGHLSDSEAAAAIREHEIDILVDLKGHTKDGRSVILNHGAAPLQVGWLGFPGSTLGIDLDYVIGDPFVLPDSSREFYHEKFCRLPETYQPNDPLNRPYPRAVSRSSLGLPEDAFIFASFNQPHKVSAEMVALWARILRSAPASYLWLMTMGQKTRANLIKEFASHGIGPERIIFTDKVSYDHHINRLGCADLALDTYPCNGHTTTSDALWGGLPVLARKGTNFASRVSESLLNAINLPELIAEDEEDYVRKALALYEERDLTASYKERIRNARLSAPLFDAERFCRHLEMAYTSMAARAGAGDAPDHFDVPALPSRTTPFTTETEIAAASKPWNDIEIVGIQVLKSAR